MITRDPGSERPGSNGEVARKRMKPVASTGFGVEPRGRFGGNKLGAVSLFPSTYPKSIDAV
jgi:hypothetical protein